MEEKKVLSTDEIKSKLLNDYNQKKSDVIYPYEVVDLPSKGLMYTDEYLSTGQLKMKYPTAKEENILTSVNLIQKNIVIDKFIESIILDPINFDDLLLVDKNSLMIDARILAYGSEYLANGTCPHCSEVKPITIDLSTTIKFPDLDEELYKNGNSFTFTLPRLKKVVEFKLLTQGVENQINEALKKHELNIKKSGNIKQAGIDISLSLRLKHMISSIDGNTDVTYINNFVDNELLSLDSIELPFLSG